MHAREVAAIMPSADQVRVKLPHSTMRWARVGFRTFASSQQIATAEIVEG
jgi:hypothetical protein